MSDRVPHLDLGGHFALGPWRVRRAGYGAMQLAGDGVFWAAPGSRRSPARAAYRGVNHLDTPQYYGPGRWESARNKMFALDFATQAQQMKAIGGQPDYALGSVHAVTRDGTLVIASASGSQLASYAWGAPT